MLSVLLGLGTPEIARAAGENAGLGGWPGLFAETFNLAVFLVVVGYLLRKPIGQALTRLTAEPLTTLRSSHQQAQEAESHLQKQREQLAQLESQRSTWLAQAETEARNERERILAAAEAQAQQIEAAAERQGQQERLQAAETLKMESARQALATAETLLSNAMNAKTRDTLLKNYLDQLKR